MERIFMNIENSKKDEPHKSVLNVSQRLDLISSNKHLQDLRIYNTCKNITKQCRTINLK